MLPQQVNLKVAGTPKQGFPSNVVQVLQTRPVPSGATVFQARPSQINTVPVQSLIASQPIQINTNTAAQYARKPQEMTSMLMHFNSHIYLLTTCVHSLQSISFSCDP